jgi:hypothetical protein
VNAIRWYNYKTQSFSSTITSGGNFYQTTNQIVRPSGSFVTDGWKVGMTGMLDQGGGNQNNGKSFVVMAVSDLVITTAQIFVAQGSGNCTLVSDAQWYDVLANYYYHRFSTDRFQYTRVYGSVKANNGSTVSQLNFKIMAGHIIQDVVNGATVSRTYYATETRKDIKANRARAVWVKQ